MKHAWQHLLFAVRRMAGATESKAHGRRWPSAVPFLGLAALLWFAVRVLPKPSRAAYPCQRVAAPLASGFLVWLLASLGAHFALRRARKHFRAARYWAAGVLGAVTLIAGVWLLVHARRPAYADYTPHPVNAPMGSARGTHPGRVTWVFDPLATNQACSNTSGDYWWYDQADGIVNTDPVRVEQMLSQTLQLLTGASSDAEAWDALFRYSNQSRGLGDVGYQAGQKIAIKVNMNSGWPGNVNLTTYQKQGTYLRMTDTSPQLMHAMIKQLVEEAGVAPADISLGDPLRYFFNQFYNKLAGDYPTVRYLDHEGKLGRTWAEPSDTPVLKYSDTEDASRFDKLPKAFIAADYMINIAALKGHDGAGITLCAKNHYGSHARSGAEHLHYTLPGPPSQYGGLTGMGHYRVLVDMMGHKDLGGKTMLFLVDGLWGAKHSIANPNKWKSAPFSNRWPSSLLASQDGVALESVGLDFLQAEYNETNYPGETHNPFFDGTEDYIHQAADPANWPAGLTYDPERDGTALGSLGTHEHWNNATDRQYTRNLQTGSGIELITAGDLPVTVFVTATAPTVAEEGGLSGELTISRTGDMSDEVTVAFAIAGTASAGVDYTALPASVTFAASQSVAPLPLTPLDDSLVEGSETVTLTLTAGPGYAIDASRAAATVTITESDVPVLSVARAGAGSGRVTSAPSGIDCGSTCEASFAPGTAVTLAAAPQPGSVFTGWSGACSGTGACAVTMDGSRSVVASFALLTLSISDVTVVEGAPAGGVTAVVTVTPSKSSSQAKPSPRHRP
jgi:uncharacterized protein (DUF362 family)